MNKADKLVEATMMALQGKLELKETKKLPRKATKRTKKTETIDVNIDDKTTVAVEGNSTIVDTEDATVLISKKEDIIPTEEPIAEPETPVAPETDIVEIPADETVMPEDVVDEPIKTELPETDNIEESKDILKLSGNMKKVPVDKEKILMSPSLNREIQAGIEARERNKKAEGMQEDQNDKEIAEKKKVRGLNLRRCANRSEKIEAMRARRKNKKKIESKKEEDTEYELPVEYGGRKSYYGKAKVVKKDNGDEELYSYGTHVGGIRNGKPYSKGKFSQTTSRHQAEYFKQKGVDPKKVDVEESKKLKAKECNGKDCKCNNELGICEGTPKTEETVPNTKTEITEKYDKKSFTEALNKYYENSKVIKNIKVNKISKIDEGLRLNATVLNTKNQSRTIYVEMKEVYSGKAFNRYTLIENKRAKKVENAKEITLMTRNNKGIIKCINVVKK